MISRRSLLAGIFASGIAPAFVGSSILMPVRRIWTPPPLLSPMLRIYNGTPERGGTLLMEMALSAGAASGGSMMLHPAGPSIFANSGIARWARIETPSGLSFNAPVNDPGGDGITLSTKQVNAGDGLFLSPMRLSLS